MVGGGKEANRSKIRHTTSLCVLWNSLKTLLIIVLNVMWMTVISLRPCLGGFPLQARVEGRRCCYKYKILYIKMDNGIFEIMEDRRQCLTIRNKTDTITKYVTKVRVTANLLEPQRVMEIVNFRSSEIGSYKGCSVNRTESHQGKI